ncbi:hypothetical protein BpHYR1_012887 [Brachionus plicatilis]|uniref:Uncharacterized protein n=1 Tax=Brachionus plicatilis TaxID=10195 RepID=A0A3M7Q7G6_BRAPC|nr:hypothetical protein BpHYR1_012887 [Brachionus plicatilis]
MRNSCLELNIQIFQQKPGRHPLELLLDPRTISSTRSLHSKMGMRFVNALTPTVGKPFDDRTFFYLRKYVIFGSTTKSKLGAGSLLVALSDFFLFFSFFESSSSSNFFKTCGSVKTSPPFLGTQSVELLPHAEIQNKPINGSTLKERNTKKRIKNRICRYFFHNA